MTDKPLFTQKLWADASSLINYLGLLPRLTLVDLLDLLRETNGNENS